MSLVALLELNQGPGEGFSPLGAGPAHLLAENLHCAGFGQLGFLGGERLALSANTRVSEDRHLELAFCAYLSSSRGLYIGLGGAVAGLARSRHAIAR
jgi:hypothetical protein